MRFPSALLATCFSLVVLSNSLVYADVTEEVEQEPSVVVPLLDTVETLVEHDDVESNLAEIIDPSSQTNRELQYDALVKVGEHFLIYGNDCPPIKEFTLGQNDFRKSNAKRIVHCYDAQCRGCQRFKHHFIRDMKQIAARNSDVEIYTISCDQFKDVCVEMYAATCLKYPNQCRYVARRGFPSIFAYPEHSRVGSFIPRFVTESNPGGYIPPLIVNALHSPHGRRLLEIEAPKQNAQQLYGGESVPVLEFSERDNDFRTSNQPKLVQFYNSGSRASQHFKRDYITLANQIVDQNQETQVYAVECERHSDICLEAYAESCMQAPETCAALAQSGYPALLAYPANKRAGTYVERFTDQSSPSGYNAEDLLKTLKDSQIQRELVEDLIKVGDDKFVLYGDENPPVLEYMNGENDFRKSNRPKFVQFYDASCAGCQRFKHLFLQLARDITAKNPDVEVYAISCDAFLDVCLDAYAKSCEAHPATCKEMAHSGFPAILGYPADARAGVYIERFANPLNPSGYEESDLLNAMMPSAALPTARMLENINEEQDVIISSQNLKGAALSVVKHITHDFVEDELYWDASHSFVSGLENNLFTSDEPLSGKKKMVLEKWLILLSVSLPQEWALHNLIHDLVVHLDSISMSRDNLLNILNKHRLPRQGWSSSCSNGMKGRGYSCGMWKLLHTMSVGFAEHRGGNDLADSTVIAPMEAASIVREYIAQFFGCVECKKNFVSKYDDCSFNRCIRFTANKESVHADDWKELALWLWEIHNDVSVMIQHKKESNADEIEALWPSVATCLSCFNEDGKWQQKAVFDYLLNTYGSGSDETTLSNRRLKSSRYTGNIYLWVMLAASLFVIAVVKQFADMGAKQAWTTVDTVKRSA